MKLGILTYHAAHNYGAALQALGLQAELSRLGHDPEFIHYYPTASELNNQYRRKAHSLGGVARNAAYAFARPLLNRRFQRFNQFRDEHFNLGNRYRSFEELNEHPPEYDAFICGSDQIWNFTQGASPTYFLRFVPESKPAIAYAPSFGRTFDPSDAPDDLSSWISRFQFLSAREDSGCKLIEQLTGRQVPQVLDPAFFLDRQQWETIARRPEFSGNYIAFYALEVTPLASHLLKHLSTILKLPIVVLGKGGMAVFKRGTKIAIDSGPAEFLGYIKNASLVVTNSFHASVFSILFGTPFLTAGHSSRNARMESLLGSLGQRDRLITSMDDVQNISKDLLHEGPSSQTSSMLRQQLASSRAFLENSLLTIQSNNF
ncbi:MAG: polysaccharide pyruvyl transferase family protein [Verrucomicrobiota bacterium JB025]|nr:polysaccharide pyruvyl transferase family protein [Verrucomicrobiota bacterium JB025]